MALVAAKRCRSPLSLKSTAKGDIKNTTKFPAIRTKGPVSLMNPVLTIPGLECTKEVVGYFLAASSNAKSVMTMACTAAFLMLKFCFRSRSERINELDSVPAPRTETTREISGEAACRRGSSWWAKRRRP